MQDQMRQVQHLEAASQAVGEATTDQQRRGAEDYNAKRGPLRRVLVPESLDRLRPSIDLLDLIEGEHGSPSSGFPAGDAGSIPLLFHPCPPAQRGFVGGSVHHTTATVLQHVTDEGGFTDLTRSCHDLDEMPVFLETTREDTGIWPVRTSRCSFLLVTLSYFTQCIE